MIWATLRGLPFSSTSNSLMVAMLKLYHSGPGPSTLCQTASALLCECVPALSLLDRTYSRLARVPFFEDGWGDLIPLRWQDPSDPIDVEWAEVKHSKRETLREGVFTSPHAPHMPKVSKRARFLLVTPPGPMRGPAVVHMAATGDEGYQRRLLSMARPLLKRGVSSAILENPYYGARRPAGQTGAGIRTVGDLLHMGTGSVREGAALVEWLATKGFGPVGVTGVSMGGQMAATVTALVDRPIASVPCLPSHSATVVFCEGLLSKGVVWRALGPTEQAARRRLRVLLEDTDIRGLPAPRAPRASILFGARLDRYVPGYSTTALHRHWGGSELHWLRGGHVHSFIAHRRKFMDGIVRALAAVG